MKMQANTWGVALAIASALAMAALDFVLSADEEIHKTLRFSDEAKSRHFIIDNIYGSITVRGYDGREVVAEIRKTIEASTESERDRAEKEVSIEIEEGGDKVELFVDGPFREKDGRRCHRVDYSVRYDFDVRLPFDTELTVRTVNDGRIAVSDHRGDFHVSNVNGSITMESIAGSGEAHTVNGSVKVDFSRDPSGSCSFKTINGDLEASFGDSLSADFHLKTFNGSIYSDYESTMRPQPPVRAEREGARFVYKSSRFGNIRIGKGGAEITMDTLNGDILIANRKAR
ncbi:MAG: hypothetical protein AB1714_31515 [Acidobacteriota bacterium]